MSLEVILDFGLLKVIVFVEIRYLGTCYYETWDNMVGVVSTVWVGRPGILGSIPDSSKIFLFYPQASRSVLRLTQKSYTICTGDAFPGVKAASS
jgi:hypothetical protein